MTKSCIACRREIDPDARLCPYCGANPETGEKFDPTPIVKSHFPDRRELGPGERLAQFLRERQGIVVAAVVIVVFVALVAAHQYLTRRAAMVQSDTPPVPLTELADFGADAQSAEPAPLPDVGFQWTGRPEVLNVMLVEPGAVPPPEAAPAPTTTAGGTAPQAQPPRPIPPTTQGPARPSQP